MIKKNPRISSNLPNMKNKHGGVSAD